MADTTSDSTRTFCEVFLQWQDKGTFIIKISRHRARGSGQVLCRLVCPTRPNHIQGPAEGQKVGERSWRHEAMVHLPLLPKCPWPSSGSLSLYVWAGQCPYLNSGFSASHVWVIQSSGSKNSVQNRHVVWSRRNFSSEGWKTRKCISCLDHKFTHGYNLDYAWFCIGIISGLLPQITSVVEVNMVTDQWNELIALVIWSPNIQTSKAHTKTVMKKNQVTQDFLCIMFPH